MNFGGNDPVETLGVTKNRYSSSAVPIAAPNNLVGPLCTGADYGEDRVEITWPILNGCSRRVHPRPPKTVRISEDYDRSLAW
jgi:hypothetical protein